MRRPEGDRSEALAAAEWLRTAYHEAAHAVAQAVLGLPLHDARIWWEPRRRGLMAVGEVRQTEAGGYWADAEDVHETNRTLVAALAGPYTEAWLLAVDTRRPLAATLAEVERRQRHGDFRVVTALLRLTPVSRADADRQAAQLVAVWWDQIGEVAVMLQVTGALAAEEIRAVVGPPELHAAAAPDEAGRAGGRARPGLFG